VFCRLTEAAIVGALLPLLPTDDPLLRADAARLAALQRSQAEAAERYFRQHAENWDAVRKWHVSDHDVEAILLDIVGPGPVGDLVDIGTGTGRILHLLAARSRRAIGIDRSAAMLAAARPAFGVFGSTNVQLRQGDMTRLPLDDQSADLVVMHQVLHYAANPSDAFREIARIVRATGRAIVVDFAPHQNESLRDEHGHRRLGFGDEEIVAWGSAAGLSVSHSHHLYGTPLTVVLWELRPTVPDSSLT
jgi:SAM-dependent methyltransferase